MNPPLSIGKLPHGPLNLITDVPGVRVGHCTVDAGDCHTGVTVVLPPCPNPFLDKLTAACQVFNGYGKTLGLVQVEELGTLETPIALTNTLNVGKVHDALVGYMIDLCREDGIQLTSVNPVVCECNDSGLSDIARRPVGEREVRAAIESAAAEFALGAVGAGRGTLCYGMKGGIGSSSRQMVTARPPGRWRSTGRYTPWGCWCRAIMAPPPISGQPACRRTWRSVIKAASSSSWPPICPCPPGN